MRKIKFLLVALFTLIGMSAFAALPQAGDKGFLYNLGSGQYITADATLGDTGVEFTIEIKEKDANATPSVEGAAFMRFKTGSNYMTFYQEPAVMSTYYGQLIVKDTEKGLLITHPYPNDQGPSWITAGSYLQVVDGALVTTDLDEANEGAYWFFGTEEELAEFLAQQQAEEEADGQAIMNNAVKAALEAAIANYSANPTDETEAALEKAKKAATSSIIAYKGVRSSYEMHKQFLSGEALEEFEEMLAGIIAALDAGTFEGNGIAEMAEIARVAAEVSAETDEELILYSYETTCEPNQNYVPGGNHGITIDWDAIAADLGTDKSGLKIYAVMPDGSLDETYGRGSAGTDGWRDAEGNWAFWNSADNLFYVQFTGLNLDGVGCMRTAEPTTYTANFKVVNAAEPEGKAVMLSISLNVKEKEIDPNALKFADLDVIATVENKFMTEVGAQYEGGKAEVDMASILTQLPAGDLKIYAVQSDGSLDASYGLGTTDGWRNAKGDWSGWGQSATAFCVKADFTMQNAECEGKYAIYYIGGYHEGAHLTEPINYTAKYAFVVGTKAVVFNYTMVYEEPYTGPVAPTPVASKLATDGETAQYFYNVEAKAFLVGANDWGTRASVDPTKGYPCRFEPNGDTYELGCKRGNNWDEKSALDYDGDGNIWVDGKGRAGAGFWTFTEKADGSFTISSTYAAGLLSIVGEGNTRLYLSEAADAKSTWIAVSEEDYATYVAAYADYQLAYDEWMKSNYGVGDDVTSLAPKTWNGDSGSFGGDGHREVYNGGGSIAEGNVLTQSLEGLKNGTYEITLELAASFTSGRGFECPTGEGLVEAFANDKTQPMNVVDRGWVSAGEFDVVTFKVSVTDGTLTYGIRNLAPAGNWYVAKLVSLVYVSEGIVAPIIITQEATAINEVNAKPTAARTIFNAAGQQMKSLQKGLNIVNGKKVYVK